MADLSNEQTKIYIYFCLYHKRTETFIVYSFKMTEENKHLLGKTKNESDCVLGNEGVVGWSDAA